MIAIFLKRFSKDDRSGSPEMLIHFRDSISETSFTEEPFFNSSRILLHNTVLINTRLTRCARTEETNTS